MAEHENPNTAQKAEQARQERYGTHRGTRQLVEPQEVPQVPQELQDEPKPKGDKRSS